VLGLRHVLLGSALGGLLHLSSDVETWVCCVPCVYCYHGVYHVVTPA